jgi:hypothetical protein
MKVKFTPALWRRWWERRECDAQGREKLRAGITELRTRIAHAEARMERTP